MRGFLLFAFAGAWRFVASQTETADRLPQRTAEHRDLGVGLRRWFSDIALR